MISVLYLGLSLVTVSLLFWCHQYFMKKSHNTLSHHDYQCSKATIKAAHYGSWHRYYNAVSRILDVTPSIPFSSVHSHICIDIFILINFIWKSKLEIERSSICCFNPPTGWAEVRNQEHCGLPQGGQSPPHWAICCCFSEAMSRELEQKWSGRNTNQHPNGMLV